MNFQLKHLVLLAFFSLGLPVNSLAAPEDFKPICGKTIRVGVRTDAPPFAFSEAEAPLTSDCTNVKNSALEGFGGFITTLCSGFLDAAEDSCSSSLPIKIEVVPIPIGSRREFLSGFQGGVDLLCGATTATVTRRVLLPTSPYTFLTGSAIIANKEFFGAREDETGEDKRCRVGVVSGTTSAIDEDFSAPEIRLPGWLQFAERNGCRPEDLDPGTRHEYVSTRSALADIAQESSAMRSADILIDDFHILNWYLNNFESVFQQESEALETSAQVRERLTLQREFISIEPYAVVGSAATDGPETKAKNIVSFDLQERPKAGFVVAAFSRYLTDLQAGRVQIYGGNYKDIMRQCFGREIDKNLWLLLELQGNTRKGEFSDR